MGWYGEEDLDDVELDRSILPSRLIDTRDIVSGPLALAATEPLCPWFWREALALLCQFAAGVSASLYERFRGPRMVLSPPEGGWSLRPTPRYGEERVAFVGVPTAGLNWRVGVEL